MEKFGQKGTGGVSAQIVQPGITFQDFRVDSVFLSYASEDRSDELQVKQAFDESGVDIWFEQSVLDSGDNYRLKLKKNIENCSYFVPLISRNTNGMEKRLFRRDWRKAIEESAAYPPDYPPLVASVRPQKYLVA